MKYVAIILLLLVPSLALAQTSVSGNQSGSWNSFQSPYLVTGEIVVPAGETLIIEPGVEINFQGHYKFNVNGKLRALGAEGNMIRFTCDNQSIGWGGIRVSSADISELTYCHIEFGKTDGDYPDMHGGGLALLGSNAVVSHCVFADNEADADGSGMGGAVYCINTGGDYVPLTFFNDCKFIRNYAYGEGGAIKFTADNHTEINNCEFIENYCNYGGGAVMGYGASGTKMTQCLFVDNYTNYSNGGAIYTLGSENTLYFINCTMTGNRSVHGDGGAASLAYTEAYFVNCIVYQNDGAYSDDVYLDWGSSGEVKYCNMSVPDGADGSFNINTNPMFVDPANGDFSLMETSTSINAGTDFMIMNGQTVVDLDPSEYCDAAPDMGVYEFCATSGAADESLAVFRMNQNYPNPFSNSTAISYSIPADSYVSAIVYNVRGQEIRSLISSKQSSGTNYVSWNGRDNGGKQVSQGVYFLQLRAGNEVTSVRMVLTK